MANRKYDYSEDVQPTEATSEMAKTSETEEITAVTAEEADLSGEMTLLPTSFTSSSLRLLTRISNSKTSSMVSVHTQGQCRISKTC